MSPPHDERRPRTGTAFQTATKQSAPTVDDLLAALAEATGGRVEPAHEASLWLRQRLHDMAWTQILGKGRRCGHRIECAALWRPDWVGCHLCAVVALAVDGDDDQRCDRCSVVCAPGGLRSGAVAVGPVIVLFGLCGECSQREAA